MGGYLRDKTRPQGDRPIHHIQDNFGGGLNVDDPATDVDNNEVIDSLNYIHFDRFSEGRPGCVEVGELPGTGGLNCRPIYHPKQKCLLFHRGTKVYRWDGVAAVELLDYPISGDAPASMGEDSNSFISPFGEDALLFVGSADIYYLLLRNNGNKLFKINLWQPLDVTLEVIPAGADLQAPYRYKYAYTFSLIVNDADGTIASGDRLAAGTEIIWESPPVLSAENVRPDLSYFREVDRVEPISSTSTQDLFMGLIDSARITGGGKWALGSVSHISWYRTVDFGQNGVNNEYVDQYGWVGDALIDVNTPGLTMLADEKTDEQVIGNTLTTFLKLSNIEWSPLKVDVTAAAKTSAVGIVSEAFVFCANKNGKTLAYSQRVNDALVGFHAPFQEHEFDDGIRVFGSTPDVLTIACNNTTHIATLTSFVSAGVLQSDFVLDHFDEVDAYIGVQEESTFVEVEQGTYIALCSDKSVRIWEGNGWSRDLALDKVGTLISKATVGLSKAVYSNGAYILWIDTIASGVVNTCLRLSLKRSSGTGWTKYGGANWPPPSTEGIALFNGDNFLTSDGINLNLTYVIDPNDTIYWIDPFNGPEGSSINGIAIESYYADKVSAGDPNGFDIKCTLKVKEITGSMESYHIIHQESHTYMRDLVDPEKNAPPPISYPALKIDARAYVDGFLARVETAGQVNSGDDIQFWYRVEGDRISIEFETNRSGHQMRRNDSRFRVQDILRPGRGMSNTVSETFQSDFQDDLKLWNFTRPEPFLDRVGLSKLSANGKTTVLAPDNRNFGVTLVSTNLLPAPFIKTNTVVFNAFTYNVWIKTPTFTGTSEVILLKINGGAQALTITINSGNFVETVEFGGSVAIDDPSTGPGNVNGWSQLLFVRQANAAIMNVYQNDSLKGTLPVNASFGGGNFEIGDVV
jgi:hypothetical protein